MPASRPRSLRYRPGPAGASSCSGGLPSPTPDIDLGSDSFVQNGPNDAVGLLNGPSLVQCVSYEGSVAGETEAVPASLLDDDASANAALYKTGTGSSASDFTWAFADNTPDALNVGQALVPEPATDTLVVLAAAGACVRPVRRSRD